MIVTVRRPHVRAFAVVGNQRSMIRPLIAVSDVRGEAWTVPGDVQLRSERDQLRVDCDDTFAHGNTERGPSGEVVRDGVDLESVRLWLLRLAERRASGADEHSGEDHDERGSPPARSPTHEARTLTQVTGGDLPNAPLCR